MNTEVFFLKSQIKNLRLKKTSKENIFRELKNDDNQFVLRKLLANLPELSDIKNYKYLIVLYIPLTIFYIGYIIYFIYENFSIHFLIYKRLFLLTSPLIGFKIDSCYIKMSGLTISLWSFLFQTFVLFLMDDLRLGNFHILILILTALNYILLNIFFPYFKLFNTNRFNKDGEIIYKK